MLATRDIIENSWRTSDKETITLAASAGGAAVFRPSTLSRTGLAQPLMIAADTAARARMRPPRHHSYDILFTVVLLVCR